MTDERKHDIGDLLRRLNSADAGPAWVEFIDRYAQVIINTAAQFEYTQDRIDDCFLYVCEKLNDDGFRRLLTFDTGGKAKFRTWLGAVVFNLCVDWHRQEFGRARLLPAIAALPAFDQSVYRLIIEQGMRKESGFQKLRMDFPDLTRESVANSLSRIHSLLTPRQRWQILVRNRGRKPSGSDPLGGMVEFLPGPEPGPDADTQDRQELEALQEAMSRLPAEKRLLLRLRFQEGLSLEKIAQLRRLGDSNRAWRHIQAAMKELVQEIQCRTSSQKRKT
jgi:RNA polymerase sigma factor (sigma-70 family)